MYIIDPSVARGATTEDLLGIRDVELDKAEEFFEKGTLSQITTVSVSAGTLRFPDNGTDLDFIDYEAKVSTTFRTTDGERVFITVDGGMLNVTQLVAALRKAVSDARG